MANVEVELYEFLKAHECHLFREKDQIKAWVCVEFFELDDFVQVIGRCAIGESGLQVTLFESYLAVELNDIIDGTGADLSDYKRVFDDTEWEDYFPIREG